MKQAEGTLHGSGGTVSPSTGSITTGPACVLNRGGAQASFRSTVSDTEVETLQVSRMRLRMPVENQKQEFTYNMILCKYLFYR